MDINQYIRNNAVKVIAKPNSPKTEIIRWDKNKQALRIAINAPPDKDKANKEMVKFLSKLLNKKVEIIRGAKSREKIIKILD